MINEGGKWAHVVLRKCVFEPKAVGMSSLMHQPLTGHLRSTVCCAVCSVPSERRCIDSPKTLVRSHSLRFTFFLFLIFIPYVHSCLSCISFTPPLFHLITPSCLFFHSSSVFLLFPYFLSSLHKQPDRICTHCTIASVFSVSVFCLSVI